MSAGSNGLGDGRTAMVDWRFKILIDYDCPLCRSEASVLKRLDRGRGRLIMENISDSHFDPQQYGTTLDAVMGSIHGVMPDGTLVQGVEVFRQAYSAVGWGWLVAPTAWPGVRWITDAGYRWFARNRLRLTGRGRCAANGRCKIT